MRQFLLTVQINEADLFATLNDEGTPPQSASAKTEYESIIKSLFTIDANAEEISNQGTSPNRTLTLKVAIERTTENLDKLLLSFLNREIQVTDIGNIEYFKNFLLEQIDSFPDFEDKLA